ncbi:MAG: TonB-dependent receptor [Proteobacteria bacterium]|nr:TonB-dependent receptor [Pseudomonadota bacterium]MDE2410765.1 TonB-dependent receptor [Sphingomonadales bacterium]
MRKIALLVASASIGALASPAFAQEVPAASDNGDGNEEIVVVAQKRAENVQNVPISITAISGEGLARANVASALDLGRVATNFNVQRASQAANVRITIRGIGAPGNTATEPSVATFLDGIYIPRTGSVINGFLDIEGVEVLRGPQGTLFGRNASVGALSLRSATPKPDFSAAITGELENANRYGVKGYVNLPLSENVAVRAAGQGRWFKGYFTNKLDGKRFGGSDEGAGRLSIKANLGKVTWIGRADYSRTTGDGQITADLDSASISAAQLSALQTRLGGVLPDTNLSDLYANHVLHGKLTDRQWGISSTLEAEVGDGFTVKLIDSYRDWKNEQVDGDVIYLPIPLLDRSGAYRSKSNNHELQFISPQGQLLGGKLDFVAGLYYFGEAFSIREQLNMQSQFCNALVPLAQRPACNTLLTSGAGQNAADQQFHQKLDSFAAYTQANVNLTDKLTLVLGGRWTKEKKDGTYIQLVNNPFAVAFRGAENTPLTLDDNRFTYRIGANYKPTSDMMLFASYSTGYKSGGFNSGGGTPALGQRRLFTRETVKDWEAGIKSNWLDNKLTANLTLYRMDIGGYQDRSFDGTSFVVRNAGNLRHQGFEFDLIAKPTRNFRVNASIAYLDSVFTSYPAGSALPGFPAGSTQNLTGTSANFAPDWTGTLGAEWRIDLGSSGLRLVNSVSASFVSDQLLGGVTDNNYLQVNQDGYALLGGRIELQGPDERWSIAVYGRNLTNENYAVNKFYQTLNTALGLNNGVFPGSTAVRVQRADPRSYGVTATYRF